MSDNYTFYLKAGCRPTNFVIVRQVWTQAAQAHYLWVRASEVIWWEYTRIISVLSDANKYTIKVFSIRWKESRLNGV